MAMSGGTCGEPCYALLSCGPFGLGSWQFKTPALLTDLLNSHETQAISPTDMWINSATSSQSDEGFKSQDSNKRFLHPLLGSRDEGYIEKMPRFSSSLSVGETLFDGKKPLDGAGESKGGAAQQGDDRQEPLSASEGAVEDRKVVKEDKTEELISRQSQSIESRVEEVEELQSDEVGEDLIRKGKEIFIQGFNWESHKNRWWHSLKEKVPELAAWGFSCMWLPPFCDSLAPQGYLPKDLYNLNSAYGSEAELKSLLRLMKKSHLKPVADIVINHRIGSTRGVGDLYNRYDGMPMPWDEYAVTSDTGGLGKPSMGEIFNGVPNLDHSNEVVANDLKNWLRWLHKDIGLECFRFDYAKGYSPKFVKDYIEASKPRLAVGEYWDTCKYVGPNYILDYDQDAHRQRTVDWIDGTAGLACAFDFTTKAILQEACAKKEWYRLRDVQGRPPGLLGVWPSRAVTFIDNHDTGSTQAHWPFPRRRVGQGYAYILTHPGQPCVFYDHLYAWSDETQKAILDLINIRRIQQLHSRSGIVILDADADGYSAVIDNKLCVRLGNTDWVPPTSVPWEVAVSGRGYMVWVKPKPLLPA